MLVSTHIYSLKETHLPQGKAPFFPTSIFIYTSEYTVKSI